MESFNFLETIKSLIWIIVVTLMSILYLPFGVFVNLMQAICYMCLRPILPTDVYKRISVKFLEMISFITMPLVSGIKIQVHTDKETFELLGKENAIVMPNHRHRIDYIILALLTERFSSFGSTLVISKDSAKFFPVMGWGSWFSGGIYLKRDWSKDQSKLESSLRSLKDYPQIFWLMFFVEGTRLTSEKLLAAQQYATSKGLPIPRNVLVPRVKGIVYAVKKMRSFVPAVYDVTIALPKGQPRPSVLSLMWGKPSVVQVHIKRFSTKDLPESDDGLVKWCRDRFVVKDNLLDKFMVEGTFKDGQHYNIHPKKPHMAAMYWICGFLLSFIVCHKFSILSSWEGIKTAAAFLIPFLTITYYSFSSVL